MDLRHLDVAYGELRPAGRGVLALTLGLVELRAVTIPAGYDAVLYAIGVETAGGRFMVGAYRESVERPEYFCAPDTVVLSNARERERALDAIRVRLKRDVVRGVVSEGHDVIVDRRLEEHLVRARVDGVADAFGDLPHRLVVRLSDLVADGKLSADDHCLFCALLEATALSEEARARVRHKLAAWVADDVGGPP